MKLQHETQNDVAILRVHGELEGDNTNAFRKHSLKCIEEGARDFILELSQCGFIDSQGLETLLWLQDQAAEQLGQVRLAAPHEHVEQIMSVTRLDSRFESHATADAARASLR